MKDDLEALQGTWNIVSLEMEGRPMAVAMLSGAKVVIEGGRFVSLNMGAGYAGSLHLDPSASPKTFDMKFETGPEKGNTAFGIYELADNTWRICLTTRGTNRPAEVAARPGTGHALEVLHRDATEALLQRQRQDG
jgi:uncharacterized protein (TIGR03067 family)